MHMSVICNHCPTRLRGWAGDSGANVRGSGFFRPPSPQWQVSVRLVILRKISPLSHPPREIYYYKEQGYDSQQVPMTKEYYSLLIPMTKFVSSLTNTKCP